MIKEYLYFKLLKIKHKLQVVFQFVNDRYIVHINLVTKYNKAEIVIIINPDTNYFTLSINNELIKVPTEKFKLTSYMLKCISKITDEKITTIVEDYVSSFDSDLPYGITRYLLKGTINEDYTFLIKLITEDKNRFIITMLKDLGLLELLKDIDEIYVERFIKCE